MKPPRVPPQTKILSSEEEEEEKKEISEINQAEDKFADQLIHLNEIGFDDLRANIVALTEAKGNMNQAIDMLIE